jgi:hypothetical protein
MRTIKRPRFWIALLCGLGAALFALMLPPQPSVTLLSSDYFISQTAETEDVFGQFRLETLLVSNDSRFVITRLTLVSREAEKIAVWDCEQNRRVPIWSFESKRRDHRMLLSPDQKSLCYIDGSPEQDELLPDGRMDRVTRPRTIRIYELASGSKLREFQSLAPEVFFGADNQLVSVQEGRMTDLESGRELKQLPVTIEKLKYKHTHGDFALYSSDDLRPTGVRVYSWTTGKECALTELPFFEFVTQVCGDGTVICWTQRSWNNIGLREPYPEKIFDVTTGQERQFSQPPGTGSFVRASPDGETVAFLDRVPPRPKWLSWLPKSSSEEQMRFLRWRTNEDLATMPHGREVRFSADGHVVGVMREDRDVEIYPFPFRKPWSLIVMAPLAAMALSWSVAWLWERRRSRRATSPGPDTSPH